ncbi:MAG: two-component regulator propeller domain-containing protein [Sphingobacteriaceae bacterium]
MQNNKLLVFDTSSKMPVNNTVGLTLGKKGEILANTWDSGIYYIDQNNVMYYNRNAGKYLSSLITSFFVDTKNNLWCAGYGGGFGIVGDSVTIGYRPNTGFQYSIINSITQDKKNRIWVGTGEGGLICKEKDNFKIYTTKQGLTSNKINCMLHDKAGSVWVGTADGGINKITPGSFKLLSNLDGFTDKPVSRIYVNKRGEILLGTIAGGLYSFNGSKFKHFKTHDFNWKIILGICENDQGDLFVGADLHGLNKFTYSKDPEIGYDSSIHLSCILNLQCRYAFNISKDPNGNMWFSNYKISDLVKLTKDHFYTFKTTDKAPLNSISALQIDSDGVVWLSPTSMGLSYIKDNKIVNLTKKNGLVDNQIYALYSGNRNELWIGTSLGLSMYNGKEFLNFTTNDGLSHNSIMSIIKDDEGRVWVATSNGLNCLRKDKQKPKGYSIENFHTTDGLKTNQFFRNSVAFDKNKRTLWWGTQKGAISLELNKFDQNKFSPLAYLANISLMDDHIDFNALKDSLNKGVDYFASDTTLTYNNLKFDGVKAYNNIPINLSLPYNRNTISFDFYAFGGQSSNKLRYRYMLEGFDETWKNSNLPNAKYSNLNAGDYIFKAQAKLQGLDWSEPFTYKFSVRPPFWNTWWFRILMVIVTISIIGMIFRWRNRQLIIRQQQLEKTVAERTDEITKQKHLIEEKHKEITDSINYAERIQKSFLATKEHLDTNLKEYFILFKPKDIVSGDFYWSSTLSNGHFILVTADSTGHGVPGAIMSLLNITSLEKAIETETEPSAIINTTRKIIIERLKKDGSEEGGKDGMDCSVCVYDFKRKKLSFAAAHNPVWIVRGKEIIEIKADKMPVGKHDKQNTPFTQHEIQLQDGDLIYTLTDGYADQFGGPTGKKFMSKNLKVLILSNSHLSLTEQKQNLDSTFANWAKNIEQIDDVTIVGIKV